MANNISHKLIGKILLKATITNTSPMLIASGKNDTSDFEVIKDKDGKPYIPAAGFAGMLRASFEEHKSLFDTKHFKYFWGTDGSVKENTNQSHVSIDDLKLVKNASLMVRDGVAIEHKTNVAQKGSKYDYELIEKGAEFSLNMEIVLRKFVLVNEKGEEIKEIERFDKSSFLQFIHFIIENAQKENYQQGAFKTNGFGILEWKDVNVYVFDFPQNGQLWFDYLNGEYKPTSIYPFQNLVPIPLPTKNALSIVGTFSLKNAFIIGSSKDEEAIKAGLDKTHLKDSAGNAVFTAKSARGPIRHRALRILNTIGKTDAEDFVNKLFGFVDETKKDARKGRFKTFETEIKGANKTQIQPRIKIDRFTGGTIETALMQTQPLWHENETFTLRFEIEDCSQEEAGLMLLVMKDLMTADLPFGGEKAIGRGLLEGISLEVKGKVEGEMDVNFSFDNSGLKDKTDKESIKLVNTWVSKLNNNHGKR